MTWTVLSRHEMPKHEKAPRIQLLEIRMLILTPRAFHEHQSIYLPSHHKQTLLLFYKQWQEVGFFTFNTPNCSLAV